MEIYDNFQINDLVDITVYENHDWGCPTMKVFMQLI